MSGVGGQVAGGRRRRRREVGRGGGVPLGTTNLGSLPREVILSDDPLSPSPLSTRPDTVAHHLPAAETLLPIVFLFSINCLLS